MGSGVEDGVEAGKRRVGADSGILDEVGCLCPVRAGSGAFGRSAGETCYISACRLPDTSMVAPTTAPSPDFRRICHERRDPPR
jgi:hypothetical protein